MSASSGDSLLTRRDFRGNTLQARDGIFRGLPLTGDDHLFYRLFTDFRKTVVSAAGPAAVDADWDEVSAVTLSLLDDGDTPDPEVGVLLLEATNGNEDDAYIQTVQDLIKPAPGKTFAVEARIYVTETVANNGNFIFGFHEEFAADVLGNAGAGLNSGAVDALVLTKVDGDTTWDLVLANGATTATAADIATATIAGWQRVGLRVDCDADNAVVRAYIDGNQVAQASITLTALGSMKFGLGLKNGSAADYDMNVDYIQFIGER